MKRILTTLIILLAGAAQVRAADLVSVATGNFTTAATWGLADTTSKNITTSTSTTALTTSNLSSATFVLPANQVQGFVVRLASRAAGTPSNTLTLTLFNNTTAASACAATINVSDLPAGTTANDSGGWIRVICSAPFTPNGTDAYLVRAVLSATTTAVSLNTNGTANNWQRLVIRSTTQAPAAGDDLHVLGGFTNAANPATLTAATVTMNETATTVYGSANTNARVPSLSISNGGTLIYAADGASFYQFRTSGNVNVHIGGTFSMGTSGTPIPRANAAQFEFVMTANNQYYFYIKGGVLNAYGQSRTSGKNVLTTHLTANSSVGATSLSVADDTGWLSGDTVAIAASGAATGAGINSQRDQVALGANAGSSSLTVPALTYAHAGAASGVRYAEVELLTRNARFTTSGGSTFSTSLQLLGGSVVNIDWASLQRFGNANAYGVECDAAFSGTLNFTNSEIFDLAVNGSSGILLQGTGTSLVQDSGVWINTNVNIAIITVANSTSTVRRTRLSATGNGRGLWISAAAGCAATYDGVTMAGANAGLEIVGASSTVMCNVTVSDFRAHTMDANGVLVSGDVDSLTMTNPVIWGAYTAGYGAVRVESATHNGPFTFTNPTFVSNYGGFVFGGSGVQQANGSRNALITVSGGLMANFSDALRGVAPVYVGTANRVSVDFAFSGTAFGTAAGAGYADFTTANFVYRPAIGIYNVFADVRATCDGCTFGPTTQVVGLSDANIVTASSAVKSNNGNGASANSSSGAVAYEGTTCDVVPCLKMTPASTTRKLQSNAAVTGRGFMVAIQTGQTPTISVKIRKDGSYTGAAPRLLAFPVGSTTATVLGTFSASANTWQTVSGTLSAAATDGVVEVVVDCDGTAGNVYVDTFAATGAKGIDGSLSWFYQGSAVAVAPGDQSGNQVPATAPTAPSGASANAASSSQINLAWTDNATDEVYVGIERCTGAACSDFAALAIVAANTVAYSDTGLTASTLYRYRIRAVNTAGASGYTSTVQATTSAGAGAPTAPSTLTATMASSTQVNLSWADNSGDETLFRIERCSGASCSTFAEIAAAAPNAVAFQNTGLVAATSYSYRVRASNAAGNSAYSNTATATTDVAPPAAHGGLVYILIP